MSAGAKHDFLYRFFALISNFLSGGPYLPGNDSFIKSSSKIHENLNLSSPDPSEQKRKNRFFSIFYIKFRFLYIFNIFPNFDPMEPCFELLDRQKIEFCSRLTYFHIFITQEMLFHEKSLKTIIWTYNSPLKPCSFNRK